MCSTLTIYFPRERNPRRWAAGELRPHPSGQGILIGDASGRDSFAPEPRRAAFYFYFFWNRTEIHHMCSFSVFFLLRRAFAKLYLASPRPSRGLQAALMATASTMLTENQATGGCAKERWKGAEQKRRNVTPEGGRSATSGVAPWATAALWHGCNVPHPACRRRLRAESLYPPPRARLWRLPPSPRARGARRVSRAVAGPAAREGAQRQT